MTVEVKLIEAEALRVGPGEKLVVRLTKSYDYEIMKELHEAFGLAQIPALIIAMDGLEFAVVKDEPDTPFTEPASYDEVG